MWNKKFVYVLNYLKHFKAVPKNNPRMDSPQQNKKSCVGDNCLFQSLYCGKVAETITVLHLPLFPKKRVTHLKQKKWTPPLNSAYWNWSRYQISAWTDNFDILDQICPKSVFPV